MLQAFRAKSIITLAGESPARKREELEAPLPALDGGILVVNSGRIEAVQSFAAFRRGGYTRCPLTDLGDICLAPALINAHCHLELSHLAGLTRRGEGFVPWLQSLIPLAAKPALPELLLPHLHEAFEQVRRGGTAHVGDVGSRNPALVARAAGQGCGLTHFLEVFGFSRPLLSDAMPQPLAAQGYCPPAASSLAPEAWEHCAIAGHSLYSTAPEGLRAAFAWCREHWRPFSIHLAESAEEEDCLLRGKGDLHELLCERLLPANWRHPGMRPVEYADRLGLLGSHTLAVHCVHCSPGDAVLLARRRVNVCLCPRSNRFIGVGLSMAEQLLDQQLLLCLGTDSLASNDDLDMREELRAARELWGFSAGAVLRMATVNAAYALGLDHLGALMPGRAAAFFIYKEFAPCSP